MSCIKQWEVKKEGGGYTLRNLVNREYIQGRSLDSEVTDLSTKKSPFVWDISASSGAYACAIPTIYLVGCLMTVSEFY